jgi:hypothetical protein
MAVSPAGGIQAQRRVTHKYTTDDINILSVLADDPVIIRYHGRSVAG